MDHTHILPNLFVGSFPKTADDIAQLKSAGITGILNLQTQEDFDYHGVDWPNVRATYFAHSIEVRRVPITDFDDDDLRNKLPKAVRVLSELLDEGRTGYVHCNVGVNRSPSTVISYLHWSLGWTLDDAERHVRKCRACAGNGSDPAGDPRPAKAISLTTPGWNLHNVFTHSQSTIE